MTRTEKKCPKCKQMVASERRQCSTPRCDYFFRGSPEAIAKNEPFYIVPPPKDEPPFDCIKLSSGWVKLLWLDSGTTATLSPKQAAVVRKALL